MLYWFQSGLTSSEYLNVVSISSLLSYGKPAIYNNLLVSPTFLHNFTSSLVFSRSTGFLSAFKVAGTADSTAIAVESQPLSFIARSISSSVVNEEIFTVFHVIFLFLIADVNSINRFLSTVILSSAKRKSVTPKLLIA